MLFLIQSCGVVASNASALAASAPAARATSARTAVSFGGWRKWMATAHRPSPSWLMPATVSNASKLSATRSTIRAAVAWSVASRATVLASGRAPSAGIHIPVAHKAFVHKPVQLKHRPVAHTGSARNSQPYPASFHQIRLVTEPPTLGRCGAAAGLGLLRVAPYTLAGAAQRARSRHPDMPVLEDLMASRLLLFTLSTAVTAATQAVPASAQSVT